MRRGLTYPLLIEDVPGGGHALLALHAGVGVETVGDEHEDHGRGEEAVDLVLLGGGADGQEEQHDPGHAQL